jgi:two-component sensor histidine kinase
MLKTLRRLLGLLILFLIPCQLCAQTDLKYSLNDLLSLLHNAPTQEKTIYYQVKISSFYLYNKLSNKKNLDIAFFYANQARILENKIKGQQPEQSAQIALARIQLRKSDPTAVLIRINAVSPLTRIRLLMMTGTYYLYKPLEEKKDLDSALYLLTKAKALSHSLSRPDLEHQAQLYIADIYEEQGDHAKSKQSFLDLLKHSKDSGDLTGAAAAASRLGDHLSFTKERLDFYQMAADLYEKAGETEEQIGMEKAIADSMLNMGLLKQSEEKLLQVLEKYKKAGYKNLQFTYDLLSAVSRLKGDLQNALSYSIKAIDYMKLTGSDASKGYFYTNLGSAYAEVGNLDQSVKYYQLALASMQHQEEDAHLTSLKLLSDELIKQGHIKEVLSLVKSYDTSDRRIFGKKTLAAIRGNCYSALHQYNLAERYYLEMIRWQAELSKMPSQMADNYYTIAEFYLQIKAYQKAEYYLKQVLPLQKGSFSLSKIRNTYLYLYKADSAQNNLISAIDNYKIYKTMNDSLMSASRNKNIQELLIEYQAKQKDQENELLRKESKLQKTELRRATLFTRFTIAGLIALSFIIGLFYYNFRSRRKASQLLLSHQQEITMKNNSLQNLIEKQARLLSEKEWLIKEIHHRIKNNLQVITSLLSAQSNYLQDESALKAIRDSQNRIQSISLIHQKLFQSDTAALVNIKIYVTELLKFLCDTFHVNQRIKFNIDIPEITLDIAQAMPLGLIINEAITNIIKYAFPDNSQGIISLSLADCQDGYYQFKISDNGIGLPSGFDLSSTSSLGMTLIKGLGEQLGGTVSIESIDGVHFSLRFPV